MERAELARLLGASPMVGEPAEASIVEETDADRFCTAFAGAVAAGGTVFLANPAWGATERAQFNALSQCKIENPKSKINHGWLCIPTGGSGGKLKLARHDQDTLHAAVRGFAAHFRATKINAVGVLPLHHVGGLMGWLRCGLTGGEFVAGDWKKFEAGELPVLPGAEGGWFLSLVPTQLQRLLGRPAAVEWLRGFRAVLVGGGPAWPELAAAGAQARLPLAFTYGATETVAAVTALRPDEFLAGERGCGTALPHAQVTVDETGAIIVAGDSLFRGYWPAGRETGTWVTEDRGEFDGHGSLHVLGRRDAVIITGGEKVDPNEVEAVLRATGEFDDVVVVGVPDATWGQSVVACYPSVGKSPDQAVVAAGLDRLAPWKRPKRFAALANWPRDAAGKVKRSELVRAASAEP